MIKTVDGLLLFQDKQSYYNYILDEKVKTINNNSIVEVHVYWHPQELREVVNTHWVCVLMPEPSLQLHVLQRSISGLQIQVVKFLDGVYSYEALNYIQSRVRLNRD